MYVAA
jgi:hypothetical protein